MKPPGGNLARTPMPPRRRGLNSAPIAPDASQPPRWGITRHGIRPGARESAQAAPRTRAASSGRRESFPPAVAALIDARDPWCIRCGTPFGLQRHHRRIKGIGGDGRDHTNCACNGVRLCADHHAWAHSGNGRREAEAEGLIIPRSTLEPFTESVLVHLEGDSGGFRKYPSCSGEWLDYAPGREAA